MIALRVIGILLTGLGGLLLVMGVIEAESVVGRIGTAVLGRLSNSALQLLVGGVAAIVVGLVMMLVKFRRAAA